MTGGRVRERFGVTVTFELEGGELLTVTRPGKPLETFAGLVDDVRRQHPGALVVCVSTPETIAGDLRGRRATDPREQGKRAPTPEAQLCGRLGLRHVLHPRLAGDSKASRSRARKRAREGQG